VGLAAVAVAGTVSLGACGRSTPSARANATSSSTGSSTSSGDHVLRVVTTTTQLTDFARVIGGDRVSVYGVLKANVDPHDYEPTPADIDAIARADVVIQNGVGLERWFASTIESASPRGILVDASQGVTLRFGEGGEADPHIWHNPQNAKIMVADIARAFESADPADAAGFEQRLAAYQGQLDGLDADIRSQLSTLTNKALVTNHDAFGYYVDHYGLDFVGAVIPSFDSQAELSPKDINDLVAKIKATGTKAIFSEASLPPKTPAKPA
jgi:ABC-type Zn uptake system ZnuABC Zn-binding protein ZnuA